MANKRGQGEGSIAKRPDGTWWARISVGRDENGKQKRKAFYGKTRKEVQEKLTAALNDINSGTYVEPSSMTVEQWVEIWMKQYKKNTLKQSTYNHKWDCIKPHIIPDIGRYKLKDLRPDIVQSFANGLINKNLSPMRVRNIVSVLQEALFQAVKNEMIVKNVALDVMLPTRNTAKREILTQEEQHRFIKAAKGDTNYGKMYILMLATGLRIGEASALEWDDIEFENSLLRVRRTSYEVRDRDNPEAKYKVVVGSPKTKASIRTIPLLPDIIDMLKGLRESQKLQKKPNGGRYEDNNLVFGNTFGKIGWRHDLRNSLLKIIEAAEVNPKITSHCLRHTFATRGLENGIPIKVMQELLGHATLSMTADLYTHVMPETKQAEIKKLQSAMGFQPRPPEQKPTQPTQ